MLKLAVISPLDSAGLNFSVAVTTLLFWYHWGEGLPAISPQRVGVKGSDGLMKITGNNNDNNTMIRW